MGRRRSNHKGKEVASIPQSAMHLVEKLQQAVKCSQEDIYAVLVQQNMDADKALSCLSHAIKSIPPWAEDRVQLVKEFVECSDDDDVFISLLNNQMDVDRAIDYLLNGKFRPVNNRKHQMKSEVCCGEHSRIEDDRIGIPASSDMGEIMPSDINEVSRNSSPKFLSSQETEHEYVSSDDSAMYKSCWSNISDDAEISKVLTSPLLDELDPIPVPETSCSTGSCDHPSVESSVGMQGLPIDEIRIGNRSINQKRHTTERSPPETNEHIGIRCSPDEVLAENNQLDNKGAYQSCIYEFGAGEVDPRDFVIRYTCCGLPQHIHICRSASSENMEYTLIPQVRRKVFDTRLPQDGADIPGWNPMSSSRDQLNTYLREGLQNHLHQNEYSIFHHQPIPRIAPSPPSSSRGRGAHVQQSKDDDKR